MPVLSYGFGVVGKFESFVRSPGRRPSVGFREEGADDDELRESRQGGKLHVGSLCSRMMKGERRAY